MNCQTTTELLSDYVDGGLTSGERTLLERHLEECATCSGEFKHLTESLKALRDTRELQTTHVFVSGVVARAAEHLHRKGNLLQGPGTEGITVATPKADAPAAATGGTPAWVPFALAATLLVAFFLGYRVSGSGHAEELAAAVQKGVEIGRARAPAERIVAVPEPVDLDREFKKQGYVRGAEGAWVHKDMKSAFDAGQVCIRGRMLSREEAVKELVGESPVPKAPDPVPVAASKSPHEILEEAGYRKVEGLYLPADWIQKWGEGLVQVGVNKWVTAGDLRDQLMKEHNLVLHEKRLMTREQMEALQSQQFIRAPEAALAANPVTRAIEGLRIGAPVNHGGLTVYPLFATGAAPEAAFRTLHDALGTGKLELLDPGSLFTVQVKNGLDSDVLLLAGELLAGGRCTRMVEQDVLVRAGKTAPVDVLCVQPSAWNAGADRFANESGHYLAPPGLRRSLVWEQGQGAVWAMLGRCLEKTHTGQVDLFHKHAGAIAAARAEFARLLEGEAGQVGVAVAFGDSLEFAELFQSPALFAAYSDRVLSGAVLEALERSADAALKPAASGHPNTVRGVKQFLEGAFSWTYETREEGLAARKEGAWVGRAITSGDTPAHAVLFALGAPAWERRAAAVVPKEKLAKAMAEYEARLKSRSAGPSQKVAEIQALASIGGPEATVVLLRHLAETDASVRSAVIHELGAARDPRALDPLVQLLARSQKDLPLFTDVVHALGRLGDERAVDPLLKQIEAGEPGPSRAVILGLPELLLQVRTRPTLERSTGRLVVLYEGADSAAKGEGLGVDPVTQNLRGPEAQVIRDACRTALAQLTGVEFSSATSGRRWWNDKDAKDKFLRERTGK